MPGASVACVTSTTIARSGRSAYAVVAEPPNVVSSCTAATATTSPAAPPASAPRRARPRARPPPRAPPLGDQPRRLVRDIAAEAVVHRARDDPPVRQLDRLAG